MDGLRDAARVLPSRVVGPWPPDGGGGLDSLGMQQVRTRLAGMCLMCWNKSGGSELATGVACFPVASTCGRVLGVARRHAPMTVLLSPVTLVTLVPHVLLQPAVACGFSAPPAQSLLEPVHFHDWDPPCEDMDHLNGAVQGGDTRE